MELIKILKENKLLSKKELKFLIDAEKLGFNVDVFIENKLHDFSNKINYKTLNIEVKKRFFLNKQL